MTKEAFNKSVQQEIQRRIAIADAKQWPTDQECAEYWERYEEREHEIWDNDRYYTLGEYETEAARNT